MNHTKEIYREERGQLLIEVLVALLVGGIFLLGATLGVSSLIRYSFESRGNQVASSFASEMVSDIESFTDTQWHNIYNLDKGVVNAYYLIPHPTSTVAIKGEESMLYIDVSAGRVGHWKFDELSEILAYDSSGNFLNATSTDLPTRLESTQCQVGKCMSFNGTSNYLRVPYDEKLDVVDEVSISTWVKVNQVGEIMGIIERSSSFNDSRDNYYMNIREDGSILGGTWNNNSQYYQYFDTPINGYIGEWVHLVFVDDGETTKAYLNGVLDGETNWGAHSIGTNERALHIGARGDGSSVFNGEIDDIRIYNRALSKEEITNLYEASLYTRYFYVDNVSRDVSGNIVPSGGENDPSTQKITVEVEWEGGRNMSLVGYSTRNDPRNYMQTDWTGGDGIEGPTTSATSTYFNSSNIDTSSYSIQLASTTASGWLESATFDTQIEGGARINNILWQGTKPTGTVVKFQLAYENASSGPWSFVGDDGTGSSYFTPATSDISLAINSIHNYRYFRYKVFLEPASSTTPVIDDVFINWTQ